MIIVAKEQRDGYTAYTAQLIYTDSIAVDNAAEIYASRSAFYKAYPEAPRFAFANTKVHWEIADFDTAKIIVVSSKGVSLTSDQHKTLAKYGTQRETHFVTTSGNVEDFEEQARLGEKLHNVLRRTSDAAPTVFIVTTATPILLAHLHTYLGIRTALNQPLGKIFYLTPNGRIY